MEYSFTACVEEHQGIFRNYGLFIPEEIYSQLPQKGRFRTQGTINGVPFNLAILHALDKGHFFVISAPFLKSLKAKVGEPIHVKFEVVSADLLEIPEEFQECLNQDEEANELFLGFTIGVRRSLVYYVNSAKSIDTRIKRSLELIHKIKTRGLSVQQAKEKKEK
ncbi:MAG: hypothetical protein CFE21_12065 [Bacteroidetes bacterium B1(2017)]|nr:MAG: hypothetical protein CFE21_12065 [Bacteroidetes bacterium B1(2017)]